MPKYEPKYEPHQLCRSGSWCACTTNMWEQRFICPDSKPRDNQGREFDGIACRCILDVMSRVVRAETDPSPPSIGHTTIPSLPILSPLTMYIVLPIESNFTSFFLDNQHLCSLSRRNKQRAPSL